MTSIINMLKHKNFADRCRGARRYLSYTKNYKFSSLWHRYNTKVYDRKKELNRKVFRRLAEHYELAQYYLWTDPRAMYPAAGDKFAE